MNYIPDALSAFTVAGYFPEGETKTSQCYSGQIQKKGRIKVMFEEHTKMGDNVEELEDGLM